MNRRLNRFLPRRGARVLALLVAAGLMAGGAAAYYLSTGSGTGSASVGTLSPATISAPATSGASIQITWTAQASMNPASQDSGISYTVQRKLGSGGSYSTLGSGGCGGSLPYPTSSCTDTVGTSGTYFYEVVAHYGGNAWTATSNEISVAADTAPPTSSIAFPVTGSFYNLGGWAAGCNMAPYSTMNAICGTAADTGPNASGVATVQVSIQRSSDNDYWNGASWVASQTWNTASTSDAWGHWTLGLAAANLTDGVTYTVKSQASDNAANVQTTPGSATFTYDTTAPTVTLTKVNGSTVSFPYSTNASVTTVGGTCGTANADIATVDWSVAGGTTESGSTSCSSGAWTATLTTELSAESTYTVAATQSDAAGNTGTSGGKSITVDKTAPVVTLTKVNGATVTFPDTTSTSVTSFGGACGTASGDSATVNWSVAGSSTQSGSAMCTSGAWTAAPGAALSGGTYTLSATQSDVAGNTGSTGNQQLIVNNTVIFGSSGTLTIPAGVTTVSFTLIGAGGGGTASGGGPGASMSGTITLASNPSGTNLKVVVGGGGIGGSAGAGGAGYGSGGIGGTGSNGGTGGAGGGGSSAVETSGSTVIVLAAGGGGAAGVRGDASGGTGGAAGLTTTSSTANTGTTGGTGTGNGGGGVGGSTSSTGTASNGGGGSPIQNGTPGGNSQAGGGGGGGGWGGGAGGHGNTGSKMGGGGGGGGSSYFANATGVTVTINPTPTSAANGGSASNGNGGAGSASFTGAGISDPPGDPTDGGSNKSQSPSSPASTITEATPTDTDSTDTTSMDTTTTDSTTTDTTTTDTTTTDTTTTDTTSSDVVPTGTTTTDTTSTETGPTDTTTTSTATTSTDTTYTAPTDTTTTDTTATETAGLSTARQVLFFAVLGGSALGAIALLTMPIPRRRRARRRKAG